MRRGDFAKFGSLAVIWAVLLLGYNNCGFRSYKAANPSHEENADFSVCEQDLQEKYKTTYYATLFTSPGTCALCHTDSGTSPYKFGSSNLALAYSTFKSVGVDRVETNALKDTHAPGVTGPGNQAILSSLRPGWDAAVAAYNSCRSGGGSLVNNDALRLDERNTPDLYFGDGRVVALSWDLQTAASPQSKSFPAMFSVDVAVTYEADGDEKHVTGYTFARPRLQMLVGEIEAEVEGIIVYVNGVKVGGLDQFASARKIARGIDTAMILDDKAVGTLPGVSSSDKISIGFGFLEIRDRTDTPPVPPAPTLTIAGGRGFTNGAVEVPVAIGNDTTARRWCVTFASGRPASANDPCPGFSGQGPVGWSTARPTRALLATLGHAPMTGETLTASVWVANSDLVMNQTSPAASVVYDILRPDAPVYTNLNADMNESTGMPVGEITGLADASEPSMWCAKEFVTGSDTPDANGCTFTNEKPRYVGLRGTGSRSVVVFARDRAGNVSLASTPRSVNNTLGRISYAQLATAGIARGLFANSCASCHGTGARPWNSSSYASSVSNKTTLLKVASGETTPSGHNGYLGERERVLLKTWLTQTTTPVEQ